MPSTRRRRCGPRPGPALARDLDLGKLARTSHTVGLSKVPDVARRILEGQVQGRTVVDVNA